AAIIGRSRVMQAAHDSFISSTYWTEGIGPVAALATIRKLQKLDVPAHIHRIGKRLRDGVRQLGEQHGVAVKLAGHPQLTTIAFDHPQNDALTTLLTVRMLAHGILSGSSFYPTLAHQDAHVDRFLAAAEIVFVELAEAIHCNDAESRIGGPVKHSSFKRLT